MTGKTHLTRVAKGGLVAIQTTLCPSTGTNNGFVGSVVGPPGTLPPVWGPTLLLEDLELVDIVRSDSKNRKGRAEDDIKEIFKKSSIVKCHVGSTVVSSKVVRVSKSKRKLELELKAPVVANTGSMVAIEAKTSSSGAFSLVAHARIFDGDKCLDGVDDESRVITTTDDVEDDDDVDEDDAPGASFKNATDTAAEGDRDKYYRDVFLKELEAHNNTKENHSSSSIVSNLKIKVPVPQVERDGGAHVIIQNFNSICLSLRRKPSHVISYLEREGDLSCFLAGIEGSSALSIKWRSPMGTFSDRFSSILKRYAKAYVVCHECHWAQTELRPSDGGGVELLCRLCNARRFV